MSFITTQMPVSCAGYRGGGVITISNGNIYVVTYDLSTYSWLYIFKSTDGGQNFTKVGQMVDYNIQGQGTGPYGIDDINPMLDTNGYIHIYVHTGTGDAQIRYNRFDTSDDTWLDSINPWPTTNITGTPFKAQMDSNGKIHLAYKSGSTTISYRNNVSGSWSDPETVLTIDTLSYYVDILVISPTLIEAFGGGGNGGVLRSYFRNTRTSGVWGTQTEYTHDCIGLPWNALARFNGSTLAFHGQEQTVDGTWNKLYINDVELDVQQWDRETWKSGIFVHPVSGDLFTVWNTKVGSNQYGVLRYQPADYPGVFSTPMVFWSGGNTGMDFPIFEYQPFFHHGGDTAFGIIFSDGYWDNIWYVKIDLRFSYSAKSAYLKGGCTPEIDWAVLSFDDTTDYEVASCPPAYMYGIGKVSSSHSSFLAGGILDNNSKSVYLIGQGAQQPPDGDVTTGGWVNELEGSILYTSIDELDINDNDYVTKTVSVNDYFEISCNDFDTGWVPTGDHYIEFRGWGLEGTITVKIELRLGAVSIMNRTQELEETANGYSFQLTDQEIDAIIDDWNSLTIRVTVTGVA